MSGAPDLSVARSSLDFGAYGALRAKAQRDQGAALQETAQQFEAMFLQMVMKSMRATVTKSDLFNSQSMETYEAMYDRELATVMARRGGIGLSQVLTQQLDPSARHVPRSTEEALSLHPGTQPKALHRDPAPKALPPREAAPLPLKGRSAP
jgi:flagellar protein FlgJ